MGVAAPAAEAADNDIGGTITAGALTAALSQASFGSVAYSFTGSTQTANTTLSVSDLRGSAAGWKLTVQASNLVSGGDTIPNTGLSFSTVADPALVAGQAIDVTHGPLKPGATTQSLNSAREVLQAHANYGEGSYTQALVLDVQIPALQDAGTYSGTFTVNQASPDA